MRKLWDLTPPPSLTSCVTLAGHLTSLSLSGTICGIWVVIVSPSQEGKSQRNNSC